MHPEYERWLQANYKANTVATMMARARRLERFYGDLDKEYERDGLASILQDLKYSAADKRAERSNPSRIEIEPEKVYSTLLDLRAAIGFYIRFKRSPGPGPGDEWPELAAMRQRFLELCPDFLTFAEDSGVYFDTERTYKDERIRRAQEILSGDTQNVNKVGKQFLDLLAPQSSNFVGWRTFAQLADAGNDAMAEAAAILGRLVLSPSPPAQAVEDAARALHPIISRGAKGKPAYGQVRILVTAALALARPTTAICVKTHFMQKAVRILTGQSIFKRRVINAEEYEAFLAIALRIRLAMEGWGWKPQDLWDVQSFLWVVNSDDWRPETGSAGASMDEDADEDQGGAMEQAPLNQILFGPPGTGKTWITAKLAVEICTRKPAPSDRASLMAAYNELVRAKRIAFTTFHQSIGYEEFVEGLRPVTEMDEGEGEPTAGFRLEPRNGIFREVCALAEQARKRTGRPGHFDFKGRNFFKMSLGRAYTDSHIYDAAIEGGYISLGWGRDVDWSDAKYENYDAIYDEWQKREPGTRGNSGNIAQVWCFRSNIKKGDIVIVSDGNLRFRAIAEVVGDYEFQPSTEGHRHRRAVRWLAILEESLPVETIYGTRFQQASCYQLKNNRMKLEALSELVRTDSDDDDSPPEPFVLIIDEINRANISKVLGELITLLEADKRLGSANALTVQLPYSLQEFGIPNNLHVIGTMNTADRSIALLDTAIRRRFQFIEMMPDYGAIDRSVEGIHLGRLLEGINRRIEWLFDRDHQIGHAYFTSLDTKAALDEVMRSKIIPLLMEYFYDDWERIRVALNDSEGHFIRVETLAAPTMLQEEAQKRTRYSVNPGNIPTEAYSTASWTTVEND